MSGYVHSGINPMIKVEPYKHENKLLVANKYGNAKVSDLKESDVTNVIQSVGNLNELNTTDKNNIVAAVNEVVAAEEEIEPFVSVFSIWLDAPTEGTGFTVTEENLGGKYLDVIVYADVPYDYEASVPVTGIYVKFGGNSVEGAFFQTLTDTVEGHMPRSRISASVTSIHGMPFLSISRRQNGYVNPDYTQAYFENFGDGRQFQYSYPSEVFDGIVSIDIDALASSLGAHLPKDTYIEVFARRKVADVSTGNES